ncbi:hypothetical protein F0P96_15870 [Hymenobacter busanensis]|uniref:Uncharacterized protein n=1 Tax=Hymenobacter busanensis TaxID=2607656 RepID=A0A7L4ZSW4_9BACT|nr:hypothetical protein [Hymenobacter busanensis]KAA9327461.1 hypothetical protein F0P96_15870 [Hymenobacter busanensis]QHJ06201.1 hypothetical protein GUY19_02365 [Hymenobacter busanensis]
MAELNIQHLQKVLADAGRNENLIREIRRAHGKMQAALDELANLLDPAYEPSERKKPGRKATNGEAVAEGEGGRRRGPGRPPKNAAANA